MAISTIGTDALAASAVTTTKLASGVPSRSQLPAGTVLQVVQGTYSTETDTSSASYVDTGLTATITPTSATSKILVCVRVNGCNKFTNNTGLNLRLLNGSTTLVYFAQNVAYSAGTNQNIVGSQTSDYLDSPASTSAQTYKVQFLSTYGASVRINNAASNSCTSTITLMEIAA